MKVMVACSAGGHWVQMRRILPAFEGFERFYVGVEPAADPALGAVRYYRGRQRHPEKPAGDAGILAELRRIVRAERPDLAVTTGAGPGFLALAVAKLVGGSRTIWIEFDRQHRADVARRAGWRGRSPTSWLVQWQHLARPGGPEFWGAVL